MIAVRPRTREESRAIWRAKRPPAPEVARPPALNLEPVLDLGNIVYHAFRGRAYCVPPLPWHEGEIILEAWLRARRCGETLEHENLPEYYSAIRTLKDACWRNVRPAGRFRRLLRRARLLRNPFDDATEIEIVEFALRLSARRTSTNVPRTRPARTATQPSPSESRGI